MSGAALSPSAPPREVTIITGASEGIGAEAARQIAARHGARAGLVLAARRREALERVAQALRADGAEVLVVPTDVTDRAACFALIDAAMAHFGRIDTLICNAGASAQAHFPDIARQDLGWMHGLMELNFWGTVWPIHAALEPLARTKGRIGIVSSVAGIFGVPGRTAYAATKFAQAGFGESLRADLAPSGISVTMIYPGVVDTQIRRTGFGADGRPLGESGIDERGMMPVARCAELMLHGIAHRRREVLMTRAMRVGRWLRLLAPVIPERIALRAVKPAHRPRPIEPRD